MLTEQPAPVRVADRRLPSLTGLRFIAAFAVFGFHLQVTHLFAPGAAASGVAYVFRQGATGVSFFFILSGFVLTWSARPGDRARRFWRRRAAKVYPNHFVTAIGALGVLVLTGGAYGVLAVLTNLLLVQAWIPRESVFFGLNTPSWSLSCEAFFYCCFPLLLRLVDRLRKPLLWPATLLAVAAVGVIPVLALALPVGVRYWFVFVFPPVRLLEFIIGILLARIVRAGYWPRLPVLPVAGIAVAGYLASGYLPTQFSYVAGTVAPLALLIPAVATADLTGTRCILRHRVMVWLGEISFAFYLIHQLLMRFAYHALGSHAWPAAAASGLAVAILALTLLASWLLYSVVERPMMARLAGRRRPVPTSAATGSATRSAEPATAGT